MVGSSSRSTLRLGIVVVHLDPRDSSIVSRRQRRLRPFRKHPRDRQGGYGVRAVSLSLLVREEGLAFEFRFRLRLSNAGRHQVGSRTIADFLWQEPRLLHQRLSALAMPVRLDVLGDYGLGDCAAGCPLAVSRHLRGEVVGRTAIDHVSP